MLTSLLWKFPDFADLTEQQWKDGWIEALLREQPDERWWVGILRCTQMGTFPAVMRGVIWDRYFEDEYSARLALDQEVAKRGYPRPKKPIVVEF